MGLIVKRKYPQPFVREILDRRELVGAEIGVWRGDNAKAMLKILDIRKLYLIDPYETYDEYKEEEKSGAFSQKALKEVEKIISRDKRVVLIRERSENAVNKIIEPLDFVFIDGNHDYEYVKKDLEMYYPLVKKGGFIAGDDISIDDVSKAVIEFSLKTKLRLHVRHNNFFFVK
ncbi:MAG: class I SAM-dependent methyltransferase [Candidatus Aenigmarchaeota archaeon]|nr:class I SAM-dependent methyltransferase [Candidatus Aenigmarchaeota archaeon]